mmetsp:Transcript_53713/g.95759  ORF Transcript_53713/g.95759 Transcript_53713/m.95759 type:complete len:154 (-) Transcript_53713:514-975(-)
MVVLTNVERNRYEEAFRVSSGGQPTLELSRLDQLLRVCGLYVTAHEVDDYKRRFGSENCIDFDGLLEVIHREKTREQEHSEELLALFKSLDKARSGYVAVSDLQMVLCNPRQEGSLRPTDFVQLLRLSGLQRAERLSVADYMNVLLSFKRYRS